MAKAKRKNITTPIKTGRLLLESKGREGDLGRMELLVATLESCVITDGWHERWESGPMPKLAADAMAYFRAQAGGAPENETEEAKVRDFVQRCGQSLDWLFSGDPAGLICKAAGNSSEASLVKATRGISPKAYDALDGQLNELKHMAEFANAICCDDMDGHGAKEGYFHIRQDEGNRLGFCCVDIIRRVDELISALTKR
jgi:hypothetical protein